MFTVKRVITNLKTSKEELEKRYEYDDLSDAISCVKKLKEADEARYHVLTSYMTKRQWHLFVDSNYDKISYHYTIGDYTVSCTIIGVLDDAKELFHIERQVNQRR